MTNEIATRADETAAVSNYLAADPPTESELEAWARDAIAISQISANIATTSLAGQYRGKPDEVTAVILAGHELGIQPMTSLKSIDVIQGQPALRAHAMRGLLQSKGHEIELLEATATYCKMRGRRKGADSWQEVEWDLDRARLLGLLSKDQWKKQPKTMLINRATGEICRLVASDALHGMPYAAEELDGYTHGEVVQPKRAPLSVASITEPGQPRADSGVVDVDTDDEHTAAVQELRDFGRQQGVDDIEALAHEELGAPVEHVSAQAIRALVARLHKAIAA
ncbi:hypothetical protein SGL43_06636 [Streptomyces globisporus]|uniref:Uncharacterized protein n=1 Tax=Streptomyces globisporus TaxID=1908 RepID=A0ABN8VEW1_STRGL|nr:hypothetical protein [Streptomyces globisporus]CAH9419581.1 hypothetical protein SGL43_06636 [Streptomyces globisporus]